MLEDVEAGEDAVGLTVLEASARVEEVQHH
jgi:hypothetical protein